MSPVTLSSTLFVTFKVSAIAIRASSIVSVSSFFNASSISFFPSSFFRNFSIKKKVIIEQLMIVDQLTRSTLSNLFCGNGENRKYFYHDLHDHISHRGSWSHFRVCLETLEETLDAHEDVDEHILTCIHIFSRLRMPVSR